MELVILAAVAENDVIGRDGGMPWSIPADLRRFKERTMGHPVIMGRRTYESIVDRLGSPLPGRTNIVLSRGTPAVEGSVVLVRSVDEAIDAARAADGDVAFVIGGATVYDQFLPRADRLELTEIHEPYPGDTTFPAWDRDRWLEVAREERDGFDFVTYVRRTRDDREL